MAEENGEGEVVEEIGEEEEEDVVVVVLKLVVAAVVEVVSKVVVAVSTDPGAETAAGAEEVEVEAAKVVVEEDAVAEKTTAARESVVVAVAAEKIVTIMTVPMSDEVAVAATTIDGTIPAPRVSAVDAAEATIATTPRLPVLSATNAGPTTIHAAATTALDRRHLNRNPRRSSNGKKMGKSPSNGKTEKSTMTTVKMIARTLLLLPTETGVTAPMTIVNVAMMTKINDDAATMTTTTMTGAKGIILAIDAAIPAIDAVIPATGATIPATDAARARTASGKVAVPNAVAFTTARRATSTTWPTRIATTRKPGRRRSIPSPLN